MNEIALNRNVAKFLQEYKDKKENLAKVLDYFENAQNVFKMACTVGGTHGMVDLKTGVVNMREMQESLLKSAWYHTYNFIGMANLASAKDKNLFAQSMIKPPEFDAANILNTFADYVINPRLNILRGLAEVFCALDSAYKSHDQVKIGVQGLPKRIILNSVTSYNSWGGQKLADVLRALAVYKGKPHPTYGEIRDLMENGELLLASLGVTLKTFGNGNGHLHFTPETCRDINEALAEYYGDVLPDCSEEKPVKKKESTAVAKDLQYYATPDAVVERVVSRFGDIKALKILEPSCGCGRFLDELAKKGADVVGVEFDAGRANISRSKGHKVLTANFLEIEPTPIYDAVVMNPPFYGTHYAKHVNHALKFLKKGGRLTSVLPCTARYDHGLVSGKWDDLPFGSFRESGTNINTTIFTMWKE